MGPEYLFVLISMTLIRGILKNLDDSIIVVEAGVHTFCYSKGLYFGHFDFRTLAVAPRTNERTILFPSLSMECTKTKNMGWCIFSTSRRRRNLFGAGNALME